MGSIETEVALPQQSVLSRRAFLGQSSAIVAGALAPAAFAQQLSDSLRGSQGYAPLDPAKKIRIGVVGGGFGSQFHWHLHPNCVVQAVSDHREERRRNLQTVYRCKQAYPSLEELIKDPEVDAVAIFTGAPDHVPNAAAAMNAGKHVISAVPACISIEQAETLMENVKRSGMTYMMAETSWFNPEAIAARELFAAGAFGDLFYSEVEYNHPITDADRQATWYANGKRTWRYGYAPMLYPTHASAYLTATTGERLTDVSCLGLLTPRIKGYGISQNRYDNPYNAMMGLFSTSGGNVCRVNVIWTGTNEGERAQWFGTKLSLFMDNVASAQTLHAQATDGPAPLSLPDYKLRLPQSMRVSSAHAGSHPFLCHEFISALVEQRVPAVDVRTALAVTVPGLLANESAKRGGERLKIPIFA